MDDVEGPYDLCLAAKRSESALLGQTLQGEEVCFWGTWIRVCDVGVKAKVIVNWDRKSLIVELRRQSQTF